MTDDLRTHIANVLSNAVADLANENYGDIPDPLDCRPLADAVIAELNLRPEKGQRSNATGPLWGANNRHTVTRYVTDWKADQ